MPQSVLELLLQYFTQYKLSTLSWGMCSMFVILLQYSVWSNTKFGVKRVQG